MCPAGVRSDRGSLAGSSCPHSRLGLLDRPLAKRHGLQAGKTLTSRDCGATFATEPTEPAYGDPGHLPAACPVPTRVLRPSPPSLAAARAAAARLCLPRLRAHRAVQDSHLLRGRERPTRPADVSHCQARAVPAMSPPPPPACCCGGGAPQPVHTLVPRQGTLCRDGGLPLGLAQLCPQG